MELDRQSRMAQCLGLHRSRRSACRRRPDGNVGHSVYRMRMARVNITMSDELYHQARSAGLNISQLAQRAIAAELSRLAKMVQLDAYLAELDAELGPTTEEERSEAATWAEGLLATKRGRRTA